MSARQKHLSTYECWTNIKTRCSNPNYKHFNRYGGRGIRLCERWRRFENFLHDMGPKPDGLTIERRDNDGHYEPGNCYWATRREQALNRPRKVRFDGLCGYEWADKLGVSHNAFYTKARKVGCEAAVAFYRQKRGD